jgi:predicted phosphodiesterase
MVQKASRVAAIYDVHGNLPALQAVLSELQSLNPSLIVVGGDVVAGPMPAEVLDPLAGLGENVCFVRDNADREVLAACGDGRYRCGRLRNSRPRRDLFSIRLLTRL